MGQMGEVILENCGMKKDGTHIKGFSGDYKAAAEILKFFKVKKLNLITNNPEKVEYLRKNKITVNKMRCCNFFTRK